MSEGVGDVSVELITVDVDLPPVLTYVPKHLRALPWSASFFRLPAQQQTAALDELDDHLADYRTDEGIRVPFSSYLVTATCRPSSSPGRTVRAQCRWWMRSIGTLGGVLAVEP